MKRVVPKGPERILTNGPEHRALIVQAIEKQERHLLQQLKNVTKSGKPYIRLLNGFYDALMYSSWASKNEEKTEYEIVLDQPFWEFLQKTKLASV